MNKLATMPRKKKADDAAGSKSDRHKPRKLTSIRRMFVDPVEVAAARLGMDVTEWVNMAIRKELERDGLWPPTDQ